MAETIHITIKHFKESGKFVFESFETANIDIWNSDEIIDYIDRMYSYNARPFVFEAWNERKDMYNCRLALKEDV